MREQPTTPAETQARWEKGSRGRFANTQLSRTCSLTPPSNRLSFTTHGPRRKPRLSRLWLCLMFCWGSLPVVPPLPRRHQRLAANNCLKFLMAWTPTPLKKMMRFRCISTENMVYFECRFVLLSSLYIYFQNSTSIVNEGFWIGLEVANTPASHLRSAARAVDYLHRAVDVIPEVDATSALC